MSEYFHIVQGDKWIGVVGPEYHIVPFPHDRITRAEQYRIENAADEHLDVIPLFELLTEPPGTVAELAGAHGVDIDAVIAKHAAKLQEIYDERTAGDHTFTGVLGSFLLSVEGFYSD